MIDKIRVVREDLGMSQLALANKLGKPQSFISKIERGERRLDLAEAAEIAAALKKPVSFFVD